MITDKYLVLKEKFDCCLSILNNQIATIKLFLLNYGISIDGIKLAESISEYKHKYRVKRQKKTVALVDKQLLDIESDDIPYIPEEIIISISNHRSIVKVNFKADSPFHLIIENQMLYVECKALNLKVPAELVRKLSADTFTESGLKVSQFVQVLGMDRVAIMGYDGCDEWYKKKQCLFCDSNPSRKGECSGRPSLNTLHTDFENNISKWLVTYKQYIKNSKEAFSEFLKQNQISPHFHFLILAGNLSDNHLEWEYVLQLASALNEVKSLKSVDSYLNLIPPLDNSFLQKAKVTGFNKLIFNLEVFHEHRFKAVCPGKHSIIPYKTYLQRMEEAVSIFGEGNIISGFVLGAQPVEELKEGAIYLTEKGITPDFSVFTPKRGTAWEHKAQPDIIEVAEFSAFLSGILKQKGYKSLYCSLSSRSSILNELNENE